MRQLVCGIRIRTIVINPVEDLKVSEFLVEIRQGSSPLRHIGLFYFLGLDVRTLAERFGDRSGQSNASNKVHPPIPVSSEIACFKTKPGSDTLVLLVSPYGRHRS